ncbi:MAG: biopolymer transporter ExbD [Pseudomonadota bacterium]
MGASVGSGNGSGKRGRRALNAEINVTPFVDVMLVLLIVFMITAPLLTTGVDVSLPKARADALPNENDDPLEITLQADGTLYIQETEVERGELVAKLRAITGEGFEDRIFFRGDEGAEFGDVMSVMTEVQGAGFRNLALVTDPKVERTR